MFWKNKKENQQEKICMELVNLAAEAIDELQKKQSKPFPKNGTIEAWIFYRIIVKERLNYVDIKLHDTIAEKFNTVFLSALFQTHLDKKVPDLLEFINGRISLYSKEIDTLSKDGYWLPHYIYYLFFENPLSYEPKLINDPIMLMKFKNSLMETFDFIVVGVDTIIRKVKNNEL